MKKTAVLLLTICATAITYISCSKEDEIVNQTDTTAIGASVTFDATTEMDVKTGILVTSNTATSKPSEATPGICANITVEKPTAESYPKIFTVDFGTAGCTSNQLTRKGKLKITLTGPVTTTGSVMTIERINYSLNEIKLEGTIVYTNTTSDQAAPKWTRKIQNGKFTGLDGRVYTSTGSHTVKQTEGFGTLTLDDNVYEMIEGNHVVTTDRGATLTLTVKESLVKKYSCEFISKGKLKIEGGALNGVIDYGNNDCDSKYTYTHESGATYTLGM
jgi:hypothetical protein